MNDIPQPSEEFKSFFNKLRYYGETKRPPVGVNRFQNNLLNTYSPPKIFKPEILTKYFNRSLDETERFYTVHTAWGNLSVFAHPDWQTSEATGNLVSLVDQVPDYLNRALLTRTSLEDIRRIHGVSAYTRRHWALEYGQTLTPEGLDWAVRNEYVSVAANPDTPLKAIEEAVQNASPDKYYGWDLAFHLAIAIAQNPHANRDMLGWVGEVLSPAALRRQADMHGVGAGTPTQVINRMMSDWKPVSTFILDNPLTPTSTLNNLSSLLKTVDAKVRFAKHPNTDRTMLTKLALTQHPEIQTALQERGTHA